MSGDLEGESKHKAAKAKYEAEKQALLDRKWSVTIEEEMKGDKKLRPGILVKVTDENSDLFSRVGRLISQVSQQKWEILFRVDGEDIDDERFVEEEFEDGRKGEFYFVFITILYFNFI